MSSVTIESCDNALWFYNKNNEESASVWNPKIVCLLSETQTGSFLCFLFGRKLVFFLCLSFLYLETLDHTQEGS